MSTVFDNNTKPAWCPGCGDFGILNAVKKALTELGRAPHQVALISGIGQASKLPHYLNCNVFDGLHGRLLPAAQGVKIANKDLTVIAVGGDGDNYGEGGNHFIHAIRRNVNITLLVHNNQVYGLTKGQASPTSDLGMVTKVQHDGVLLTPFNPMAIAIALDCGFVARSFAGNPAHLTDTIKQAVNHNGFALVDILQPCVTFNKINTYKWYRERVYDIGKEAGYNPSDRLKAFAKSLEWGDKIPIGLIYKKDKASYIDSVSVLQDKPLVNQPHQPEKITDLLAEFV
ncbi:MAG: 2-oxoacid:ferredoxin oxidoreductase subunit beta [Planctomycetes bacterium]|nr:2-oxoacid:ferredoxin oxidoreductase subunit beta [Planctomycetota bacterium]